jgi:predicted nuclease of restriction endonuclease-like RecB superfamily
MSRVSPVVFLSLSVPGLITTYTLYNVYALLHSAYHIKIHFLHHRKLYISATKAKQLMLFKEKIGLL